MPTLARSSIAAPTTAQRLPSSLLIENASEQFIAPSAPGPEAFPIKANDYPDKWLNEAEIP
jgi:hypothetical protein